MRIFLSLLGVTAIIAGCSSSPQTPQTPENTSSPAVLSYQQSVDATSKRITSSEEFDSCLKPHVDSCIQMVGNDLALREKNTAICAELSHDDQRDACEFGVIISLGSESGDLGLCEQISNAGYKQECRRVMHQQVAISRQDITVCEQIPVEETDPDMPSMEDVRDQCRLDVITRMPHATEASCNAITTASIAEHCRDIVRIQAQQNTPEPLPIAPPSLPVE